MNAKSKISRSKELVHWVRLAAVGLCLVSMVSGCGEATESPEQDETTGSAYPESKAEAAQATNHGKADWSVDICQRNSWYGDRACDWFCPSTDPDCNLEPLGPTPSGEATRYPIVLAHGFMGSDTNFWSFHRVRDVLEGDGHRVFEMEVPPFHSVPVRAERLGEQVDDILARTGADKVNIVAHSMGGIDARYLVSSLGYSEHVASLTTVSSPHRGTRLADVYLGLMPEAADRAVDAVARMAGGTFSEVAGEADVRAAMESIARENIVEFNAANPDAPQVYYQSWAGISSALGVRVDGIAEECDHKLLMHEGSIDHMNQLLWGAAAIVAGTDLTLNDGMVTVASARWGNFRGCIPADHLDQVGQIKNDVRDKNTGFDHLRFYRNLAYDLADRGM